MAAPPRGNGAGDAQEEVVVRAILRGVCEKLTGGVGQVVHY
jgi:hypothetical protein